MSLQENIDWYNQLGNDENYESAAAKIEFAVELQRIMDQCGITKRELATRLGKSPAYITKALSGDENLTIETMVRFCRAVGGHYSSHISHSGSKVRWFDCIERNSTDTPSAEAVSAWASSSVRKVAR